MVGTHTLPFITSKRQRYVCYSVTMMTTSDQKDIHLCPKYDNKRVLKVFMYLLRS